ncbi:peptide chain release factor N(5)-glutamine methyltransferase [Candidatus Odyssella acanthamoebae]|uniref:peptide chain release factor N(5)-glutamine methyltransferase n=1 Tax=Candidatus Odyssella acanthamoebae TaxID=91604 RepID=UPI00068A3B88|nr:peptide chain release factor N(5)-glutamine methyltransferase [Candidatus Paracaedibacter acanthamoebae]
MKFQAAFKKLLEKMQGSPAENPVRELRLLIGHVLGLSQEKLLFEVPLEISPATFETLSNYVDRRCQHEPLAKILGYKEFWGLKFKVTADTLDPRPDSEILIETALKYISNLPSPVHVLDLGTGSGCLLLSLLSEVPKATGVGIDFSEAALAVAQENAKALGLQDRCQFVQSNWFEAIAGSFDIILANPPYIDPSETLSRQTLYDPASALFAEDKGLADYKAILQSARGYLKNKGIIILEIGHAQADSVNFIAQENEFNLLVKVKDFNQLDRCVVFS